VILAGVDLPDSECLSLIRRAECAIASMR
jgi:hypothetical protein